MRAGPVLAATLALTALTGCQAATVDSSAAEACVPAAAELVPSDGVLVGVNLDWGRQTLAEYATRLGHRPATVVSFTGFPLSPDDERNLDGAVDQVTAGGGVLLLTLEPHAGLGEVTDEVAAALAARLDGYNCRGVPVIVRFAHEMNGSWYEWGQQPTAYVGAFRRLAAAVHAGAPGSAMMWAPNYGGGYPFGGGQHQAAPGSPDATDLDTDGDGAVTAADDPYAPYWPGKDVVDWVGTSLYHWGDAYPWGENEIPEPGKFVAQLTGEYVGRGGDDRAVPDFYGTYGEQYGKPVAVAETAALFAPGAGGTAELAVKQAWWQQVFAADVHERLPRLAMVNWFEWDKREEELGGRVDWRATADAAVRAAYRADLPEWAVWAAAPPADRQR
jgi:hypothetical protein